MSEQAIRMNLTLESRIQRLNEMVDEGRIIRNDWTGTDQQGRETACLLAALSPEAGEDETASACPAEVMPTWFAHLTPFLDDACSATAWPQVIRRYAACAARWSVLNDAAWRRVEIAARRAAVVEAMRHTTDEQTLTACRGVLVWLDAAMPESSQFDVKAATAADAAAVWAVWAAKEAAHAEAEAAWAAASSAAKAAAEAARSEAADRIIDAVLSALEQECQA